MQEFVININDAGQRLDKYLAKSFPNMPKSLAYKFIRTKIIKVNRKRARPEMMLNEGDVVTSFAPYEFTEKTGDGLSFTRLNPRVRVVYEDDDILLCDKPAGMSSVPDEKETDDTLIDHVKAYLYKKGEYDPEKENSFVPALCNRIDRNTGGIVIAAKNAAALREINELIRRREITKKYLCVVHGTPEKREARLTAYVIKDPEENKVRVFDSDPGTANSRTMITGYRVLAERGGLALLDVELFTGRTHQIRAHMAHIGHPLLGDGKYGVNRDDKKLGYKYQALYSYFLKMKGKEYVIPPEKIWFVHDLFPELSIKI
ncbi:MAG: RluA family pseudouridine synthase [Clostridia bacterium]|nr:RluA family pseudouridine synthase [Clostridia bacterium]